MISEKFSIEMYLKMDHSTASTPQPKVTSLDQLDPSAIYTYADYFSWRLKERLELLRGKIALMSPAPNRYHQEVVGNLHLYLGNFLRKQPCKVFMAPFDVRLPRPHSAADDPIFTVVQPDLCVVCDESKLDAQGCIGAPDLVVEVLSPGNARKEMREKFELYEEAGVREYWLVNPAERSVFRYLRNEAGIFLAPQPLTDQETLLTDLLPGLEIDLGEVFN